MRAGWRVGMGRRIGGGREVLRSDGGWGKAGEGVGRGVCRRRDGVGLQIRVVKYFVRAVRMVHVEY